MKIRLSAFSFQRPGKSGHFPHSLKAARRKPQAGFTLVETLAAILLVTVAIVAPMALTVQSLSVAYYARDQITASNLAQEGIEGVRTVRDGNILSSAEGNTVPLFQGIPVDGSNFKVDGTQTNPANIISSCGGACPFLDLNNGLYAYTGTPTGFTRTMTATVVWSDSGGNAQEIRVTSTVTWKTAAYQTRQIRLTENLYNWATPGSGV
jgi:Tfp pilus assembly protein PilV